MEKLKAAVVGAGIFGSFHCRAFSEMPDVELVAICDLNKARAEKIAAEFNLLPSGGSDFHGSVKPDISLGTGRGGLRISSEIYSDLLALAQR